MLENSIDYGVLYSDGEFDYILTKIELERKEFFQKVFDGKNGLDYFYSFSDEILSFFPVEYKKAEVRFINQTHDGTDYYLSLCKDFETVGVVISLSDKKDFNEIILRMNTYPRKILELKFKDNLVCGANCYELQAGEMPRFTLCDDVSKLNLKNR